MEFVVIYSDILVGISVVTPELTSIEPVLELFNVVVAFDMLPSDRFLELSDETADVLASLVLGSLLEVTADVLDADDDADDFDNTDDVDGFDGAGGVDGADGVDGVADDVSDLDDTDGADAIDDAEVGFDNVDVGFDDTDDVFDVGGADDGFDVDDTNDGFGVDVDDDTFDDPDDLVGVDDVGSVDEFPFVVAFAEAVGDGPL